MINDYCFMTVGAPPLPPPVTGGFSRLVTCLRHVSNGWHWIYISVQIVGYR